MFDIYKIYVNIHLSNDKNPIELVSESRDKEEIILLTLGEKIK